MKAFSLIFILVGCLCGGAFCQCCDFRLIRKDTTVDKGIFVIEPKDGFRAKVTFEPIPVVITMTDNMDSKNIYSGTWSNGSTTASGFQQNTIAWSNTVGNTVTFSFTGKKLELYSEYKTTHGRAGISIDAGSEVPLNLGKENSGPGIVSEWNWPTSGPHTIVVRILDSKPVVIDAWRVTSD